MNEIFVEVDGFERYKVGSLGNIRSLITGKILKPYKHPNGLMTVNLCDSYGEKYQKQIHHLVADAFLPNPDNYFFIRHKDGDRSNNCVDNLEWCSTNKE